MAGPLNSIFAACETIVTLNLAASSIVPTYGHSGVDRFIEQAPPRIVWVPTSEDYQPPRGEGGDTAPDSTGSLINPGNALAPLYTRAVNVEVDLWAADRDTVETMINAFASAVHDTLSQGSYGVLNARWLMPEESQKDGEVYRVTYQFLIPVIRVQPATSLVTIATETITPQFKPLLGS